MNAEWKLRARKNPTGEEHEAQGGASRSRAHLSSSVMSKPMFSAPLQPGIVSLFSSTSSDPLFLFSAHTDKSLPSDSIIHFVDDETSQSPGPPQPASLINVSGTRHAEDTMTGKDPQHALSQTVLHLQSPTLPTTFIQSPPHGSDSRSLGLKHSWVQFQIRNLGRECSVEIGIVDQMGRGGRIRLSTFQVNLSPLSPPIFPALLSGTTPPSFLFAVVSQNLTSYLLKISDKQEEPHLKLPPSSTRRNIHLPKSFPTSNRSPLLHLPLTFPPPSSHAFSSWATITLSIPSLLPYFTSLAKSDYHSTSGDSDLPLSQSIESIDLRTLPNGTYSHVSYVRVYATCRLRRIWFSETNPSQSHKVPWEFELYWGGV